MMASGSQKNDDDDDDFKPNPESDEEGEKLDYEGLPAKNDVVEVDHDNANIKNVKKSAATLAKERWEKKVVAGSMIGPSKLSRL